MAKDITLNELIKTIDNYQLVGHLEDIHLSNAKKIEDADEESIVWLKPGIKNRKELLENTKAKIIICSLDDADPTLNKIFICVDNPKLTFIKILQIFFTTKTSWGIHKSAIIHPEAIIAKDVFIGPFTYIGKSTLDTGCIIYGNCYIYDNVNIGKNVKIHAGTVIGSDGFGYSRNQLQEFEQFPHLGGVIIEDNVDIGSNTSIDRGTLGDTIIKKGAKIDNLVHIAHNVIIGAHSAVIANAMIGGSVVVDDYSWIAPSASIMNQIKIGQNATIGLGAVLTKTVPAGETWLGSPARPLDQFMKLQNIFKKLITWK